MKQKVNELVVMDPQGFSMKNFFYAVYDTNDMIVTTCENYNELAKFFNKTNSNSLRAAVSRNTRILFHHNWYQIYKIDARKIENDKI